MAEKKIHVAQELLSIAQTICDYEFTTVHNSDATHVKWANCSDYKPGLELDAWLAAPKKPQQPPSIVKAAGMTAVFDMTEYTIVLKRNKPAGHLDDDPFAAHILEDFRQYRPAVLLPQQRITVR